MVRRKFLATCTVMAIAPVLSSFEVFADTIRREGDGLVEWNAEEFHTARQFVDVAAGKIAFVERGSGPVALFLHGYPLNGFHWRGSMTRLAPLRRCIAPDLMGLGYTDVAADTDLSPSAQAAMLIAFLDNLKISEVDIIANDSATGIAQLLAAHHPERIRTLLLTNGDVQTNSPPAKLLPFLDRARRGEVASWYERHVTDNAFARSHKGIGNAYHNPDRTLTHEVIETYFRPLISSEKRRRQGELYGIAMSPNPLPSVQPKLRSFDKPVRIVWARANELFPDHWAHWLDTTFPNSQGIRFVDNAKLFFPEERSDIIALEARGLWQPRQ
jgi:haloalkane dehalogenase